ncbi:MAG: ABC transporter ATP-binding protein/permease, partial [Clostridiales bacterium]|nr:ABC transporter ATP-binding protein/permease [Clostridiales bacterium]
MGKTNLEDKNRQYTKSGLLRYFLKGSVAMFLFAVACGMAMTFLSVVIPKIIGFTIDCVIGDAPPPDSYSGAVELLGGIAALKNGIWIVALVIIGIALFATVFRYCSIYFNTRANQILMRRMRNTLFSHIQRLPLSWQTENNTGDIIQRCTSDADTISNFITNQFFTLVRIVFLLLLSLVFMFTIDVRLAAIASAFIPVLFGYSVFFQVRARKSFKRCDENEGILSTCAQENLTGVRVVRAFGKERKERDKFNKQNEYYTNLWVRLERFLTLFWTTSDFIAALQLLFIIVIGTVFCVRGGMTAGDLVAFVSYNTMMLGPVRQLGRIISNLSKAGVSLGRIAEVMNAREEDYRASDEAVSGDIVFDNVSFSYESGKPVLSGVSFVIPQGSTFGIIGATGSGKSTVACLIDGLYTASSGTVSIGGRNVADIPPTVLRSNIGFVMQEGYIYSRTIAENIAIATDGANDDDVRRCARIACLDANIAGFANGYDTVVGERGVTLSGGQRQRVAIARTVARETPYIIFDDSLSAVDSETDASIRANLAELNGNATTIIISHRISTVMRADNIIVMDGGKIVERGTHAQLLSADGIYKKIYELQTALPDEIEKEADGVE